jgi:phosphoesterase RecJ-like protein
MTVTREDRKHYGAKGSDLDGIVDYARSLVTAQIAIMVVERKNEIKVSLRSKGADVSQIAQGFGGGGHREAAGFEIKNATTIDCVEAVLDAIREKEILQ